MKFASGVDELASGGSSSHIFDKLQGCFPTHAQAIGKQAE